MQYGALLKLHDALNLAFNIIFGWQKTFCMEASSSLVNIATTISTQGQGYVKVKCSDLVILTNATRDVDSATSSSIAYSATASSSSSCSRGSLGYCLHHIILGHPALWPTS